MRGFSAAGLEASVFLLSTSLVAPRSKAVLPRWLAALTGAGAIALMTPLLRAMLDQASHVLISIHLRGPAP